jgi:hypothetical protein
MTDEKLAELIEALRSMDPAGTSPARRAAAQEALAALYRALAAK